MRLEKLSEMLLFPLFAHLVSSLEWNLKLPCWSVFPQVKEVWSCVYIDTWWPGCTLPLPSPNPVNSVKGHFWPRARRIICSNTLTTLSIPLWSSRDYSLSLKWPNNETRKVFERFVFQNEQQISWYHRIGSYFFCFNWRVEEFQSKMLMPNANASSVL